MCAYSWAPPQTPQTEGPSACPHSLAVETGVQGNHQPAFHVQRAALARGLFLPHPGHPRRSCSQSPCTGRSHQGLRYHEKNLVGEQEQGDSAIPRHSRACTLISCRHQECACTRCTLRPSATDQSCWQEVHGTQERPTAKDGWAPAEWPNPNEIQTETHQELSSPRHGLLYTALSTLNIEKIVVT